MHAQSTLAESEFANEFIEIASEFRARISNSHMQYSTPQRLTSVYYRTSVPCATTRVTDCPPPFTVRMAPPRAFSPLASLRASHSMSSRNSSTATSPKTTTETSAPATARMASPPASVPGPFLDLLSMDPADLRACTGSRTGRTVGLRPTAPVPRVSLATNGLPPHLAYLTSIWTTLGPEHRVELETGSLHDVEEGLARARVSTEDNATTTADRHAAELATAEHKRLVAPLQDKLTTLRQHTATARSDIQEQEARVASPAAQERSTIAAIAVAERGHTSFLSGLSTHQPAPSHPAGHAALTARQHPAPANPITLVAPSAPQPMALGAPVVPTAAAATRPLGSTAPAPTRPLVILADTLTTRHMQPPAPRESRDPPSFTSWSARNLMGAHRKTLPPQPRAGPRDASSHPS